jgi:CheY-like chemotaxis protein
MHFSLLSDLSHDLRSPLSAISTSSEALQTGLFGELSEVQQQIMSQIHLSTQEMLCMVDQMSRIPKLADTQLTEPESCYPQRLLQQAVKSVTAVAAQREIKITVAELADITFLSDTQVLSDVVTELLYAGLLTCAKGSTLHCRWVPPSKETQEAVDAKWMLEVTSASSQQISAGELAAEFADQVCRLRRLGFLLLQQSVRYLCGQLTGQRTSDGVGCCWQVRLQPPARAARPDQAFFVGESSSMKSSESTTCTTEAHSHVPVVLFADDQPALLAVAMHYLENLGCTVHAAYDGQTAVEIAHELQPDLILMDVRMPGLDGIEAIRQIRTHGSHKMRSVPIVTLSGLVTPNERERCMAAGANRHLGKPFNIQDIDQLVAQYLATSGV